MIFFILGGIGYGIIELLWRGRTHWSMLLAGGLCFMIFSLVADKFRNRSLLLKAVLCAVAVTAVELVFGIIFNIMFKMHVWDYSGVPLNFLGQICPRYTLLWGLLALGFVPLAEVLNRRLAVSE